MPKFIGFNKSSFDPKKYQRMTQKNDGKAISTQDILAGWEKLKPSLEGDFVDMMKSSPTMIKDLKPSS